jgi:hypothetical protein
MWYKTSGYLQQVHGIIWNNGKWHFCKSTLNQRNDSFQNISESETNIDTEEEIEYQLQNEYEELIRRHEQRSKNIDLQEKIELLKSKGKVRYVYCFEIQVILAPFGQR